MLAVIIVGAFIVGVFAFEIVSMWWRQNAWRRQWRNKDANDS